MSYIRKYSVCVAYLCFRDKRVRSPPSIFEDANGIIYTTIFTIMIIRVVTMIAFVACIIRIDSYTLTYFKDGHFRSDFIDSTYKLVPKSQRSILSTGKASLKNYIISKSKRVCICISIYVYTRVSDNTSCYETINKVLTFILDHVISNRSAIKFKKIK